MTLPLNKKGELVKVFSNGLPFVAIFIADNLLMSFAHSKNINPFMPKRNFKDAPPLMGY